MYVVGFGERRFKRRTLVAVLVLAVLLSVILYGQVFRKSPVLSVSAVEMGANVGVYWDEGCTQSVQSISWGSLTPGGTAQVVVYVRNEGNETFMPALATLNWQPENASGWLKFSWSCPNSSIASGQVVTITQALQVASDIPQGFSGFSFNIVYEGTKYFLGDIDRDGTVNLGDLETLAKAYGSHPGDPRWNPDADLNKDGVVDLGDLYLLIKNFGKTSTG